MPRKPDPAGPTREFKDWLISQWATRHGVAPGWAAAPQSWIRLAELHRLLGEDEVRRRWLAFLEDDSRPWSIAHLMTTFVSVSDLYAEALRPMTAAEYWESRRREHLRKKETGS